MRLLLPPENTKDGQINTSSDVSAKATIAEQLNHIVVTEVPAHLIGIRIDSEVTK